MDRKSTLELPIDLSKIDITGIDVHVVFSDETREQYDARMREAFPTWWDSIPTPDPNAEGM